MSNNLLPACVHTQMAKQLAGEMEFVGSSVGVGAAVLFLDSNRDLIFVQSLWRKEVETRQALVVWM